ncbi:hypothetical protein RN001_000114 [Aquatica leii]|uniref:Odorant-binding protein n=1 Tax=Aquatica leii TaxID=1421715 RepID=A0AAN7SQG2_9COLE|nr:hypothetical protein RN001_000114 [Aquatica leii]
MLSFACLCNALLEAPLDYRISWEEVAEKYRSECICEIGISPAVALGFFGRGQYSSDPCIYCYIDCVNTKMNLLDSATAAINEHEYLRQIAGTTPPMVSKCRNQTEGEVPLGYRISWDGVVAKYVSECICEIGVSPALATDFFLKGEYSIDRCVYCYIKCLAIKMNLLNPANTGVNEYEYLRQIAGTTPSMVSKLNFLLLLMTNAYIIVLLCLASLSNALMEVPLDIRLSWDDVMKKYESECICQIGVSSAAAADFFLKAQYSVDRCIYCYVRCVAEKLNLLNPSNGELNVNEYLRQIAGTNLNMLTKCKNDTALLKDFCDVAYSMYSCIVTNTVVTV